MFWPFIIIITTTIIILWEREYEAGSIPSGESDAGLNLTTLVSWREPRSRVGPLTDWTTQAPQNSF